MAEKKRLEQLKEQGGATTSGDTPPAAQEGLRLNRALAMAGVCSRRKADELILAGRVAVNGLVSPEPGRRIDPHGDTLSVDGKPVTLPLPGHDHAYILLHKPVEVVTTMSDPQGRTTVLDLLPEELRRRRPFPVGRLDYFSEGLLLLTTDGDLAQRMTHPSHHLDKGYELLVRGRVPPRALDVMRSGMRLAEGDVLAPAGVEVLTQNERSTLLRLVLHQGVNRQIRRMCRDLGLIVLRLKRVRQGALTLGGLAPGKWRLLAPEEIRELRSAMGLSLE